MPVVLWLLRPQQIVSVRKAEKKAWKRSKRERKAVARSQIDEGARAVRSLALVAFRRPVVPVVGEAGLVVPQEGVKSRVRGGALLLDEPSSTHARAFI